MNRTDLGGLQRLWAWLGNGHVNYCYCFGARIITSWQQKSLRNATRIHYAVTKDFVALAGCELRLLVAIGRMQLFSLGTEQDVRRIYPDSAVDSMLFC